MMRPETPSEIFQFNAGVYRKMVDENYLFHKEVYGHLHQRMKNNGLFRFMDVACGDADCTAGALTKTSIVEYHGIDIVPEALAIAETGLRKALDCPIHLYEADFATLLPQWKDEVDVVWIGLSLHHLQAEGKLRTMQSIRRFLGPGGELLIYENTSPDGEDRRGWLERWDLQRDSWTAYSEEEYSRMSEHVHACDYPETRCRWLELGRSAGFAEIDEIYASPSDLFRMYSFS